jgi:hypothetical protein
MAKHLKKRLKISYLNDLAFYKISCFALKKNKMEHFMLAYFQK